MQRVYVILILVCISLLTMNLQCGADYSIPSFVIEHAFKEPVSVYPYQTDYKTGDTLWLSFQASGTQLFDTISNKTIDFDSAYFEVSASMELEYDYPYDYTGPFASFIFPASSEGTVYEDYGPGSSVIGGVFKFGCINSSGYNFRLGLVLQKKGVFTVRFNNNLVGKCCDSCILGHDLMNYFFDVNDTHLDFYNQIPFKNLGKTPSKNVMLEKKTDIVFQVN